MRRFLHGAKMRPCCLSASSETAQCLLLVDGRRVKMGKEVNLCGLPAQILPRTHLKCPRVCLLLLLLSMMLQWWVWISGMWQRCFFFFFYEQRVAHQTQLISIHKAPELLLLSCATAKSAWEALMRAQSAQECRLKVSRHKYCLVWRDATRKKSAHPQSAVNW